MLINMNLPHIADPERRKQTEALHLLGLGNPEDNANACYLFSDASRSVTRSNLVVDGGGYHEVEYK